MALRPRLSPGVPLSRDGKAELPSGTRSVKQISGLRLLIRSVAELQVRGPRLQGAVLPGIEQHVAWRQRMEHVRGHLFDHAGPLGGESPPLPSERRRYPGPALTIG